MPSIYLIRLNGEPKYVGYTNRSIESRWAKHLSAARRGWTQVLYRAIRKHGESAFTIESLMEHEDAAYLLHEMERKFITEYKTHIRHGKGYNLTDGGEGAIGWIPTEETKQRISDAKRGKSVSDETRQRISDSKKGSVSWMKGRKHSDEAKQKMSLSKKGKPSPKKGIKGKPHSIETRQKMSESHRKRFPLNTTDG